MSGRDDFSPVCEKCGLEITTGLMAVFCPSRYECAFWPDATDKDAYEWVDELWEQQNG